MVTLSSPRSLRRSYIVTAFMPFKENVRITEEFQEIGSIEKVPLLPGAQAVIVLCSVHQAYWSHGSIEGLAIAVCTNRANDMMSYAANAQERWRMGLHSPSTYVQGLPSFRWWRHHWQASQSICCRSRHCTSRYQIIFCLALFVFVQASNLSMP